MEPCLLSPTADHQHSPGKCGSRCKNYLATEWCHLCGSLPAVNHPDHHPAQPTQRKRNSITFMLFTPKRCCRSLSLPYGSVETYVINKIVLTVSDLNLFSIHDKLSDCSQTRFITRFPFPNQARMQHHCVRHNTSFYDSLMVSCEPLRTGTRVIQSTVNQLHHTTLAATDGIVWINDRMGCHEVVRI